MKSFALLALVASTAANTPHFDGSAKNPLSAWGNLNNRWQKGTPAPRHPGVKGSHHHFKKGPVEYFSDAPTPAPPTRAPTPSPTPLPPPPVYKDCNYCKKVYAHGSHFAGCGASYCNLAQCFDGVVHLRHSKPQAVYNKKSGWANCPHKVTGVQGWLEPVSKAACPLGNKNLKNCNVVGCGQLCEGDGECGTNNNLNQCNPGSWDIYRRHCGTVKKCPGLMKGNKCTHVSCQWTYSRTAKKNVVKVKVHQHSSKWLWRHYNNGRTHHCAHNKFTKKCNCVCK